MKKVLLASLMLSFGASVIAQNKMNLRSSVDTTPHLAPNAIKRMVDTQSNPSGSHANKTQSILTTPTGFGPNAYSTLENIVNQVDVAPEMDYIAFIHRNDQNTYGGNSGKLKIDFSADGGATFTCDNGLLSQPGASPTGLTAINLNESVSASNARHPSLAIYNPAGNTDPCNVVHVWSAPGLVGSDWAHFQTGAATNIDPNCGTQNFSASSTAQPVYGTSLVHGTGAEFWYPTTFYRNGSLDAGDTIEIWKGTYASGNINWVKNANIIANSHYDTSDGTASLGRPVMGWSPDGMHGYVAFSGVDKNKIYMHADKGNTRSQGMGWTETHDAGLTWSPISYLDPWTVPGVKDTLSLYFLQADSTLDSAAAIPYVSDLDIVVDKYGKPHIAFYVMNKYMDGTPTNPDDSLGYISPGMPKALMELTLDGSNNWMANHVAYLNGFKTDVGALSIYLRVQAARDALGESVFFLYTDDSSATSTTAMEPDLWSWSRMVDVNPTTPPSDWTSGDANWDGKVWLPQLAPVTRLDAVNNVGYPAAFFVGMGADETSQVTYQYVNNLSFPFLMSKDAKLTSNVLNINAYPNPTKGQLNLDVTFKGTENGSIRLVDVMGRNVYAETFKGQDKIQNTLHLNVPAGLYILKVETSAGSSERKIVVE